MPGILRTIARVANRHDARPLGFRDQPERILLSVKEGVAPSSKPPVRIFVGTEPAQYRAERVFVFSIEQVRDPTRVYEIYLMSDLAGFDRTRWLTGFTNYRFAIPHFAGGIGRAIYNDVDQVYLHDPARLFDLDMAGKGYLSITPRDTSVMLIDCARMARVWDLDDVRRLRRKRIEARTQAKGDFWGPLEREWNSRDEEYVAGRSHVLHYTTIHTQPWQPFPDRYVYQRNAVSHVWLDLERRADLAHYQVFSAAQPSTQYRRVIRRLADSPAVRNTAPTDRQLAADLEQFLRDAGTTSVGAFQLGRGDGLYLPITAAAGRDISRTVTDELATLPEHAFDVIVSAGALECLPDEDVPWLIECLFRSARRGVFLSAGSDSAAAVLADETTLPGVARPQSWWLTHVHRASARYPDVHWRFVWRDRACIPYRFERFAGGRRIDGQLPVVWVLKDHKAGHTTQSIGLAEALGFPYETKELQFNLLNHFSNRLRGASTLGLRAVDSAPLAPPWPDLVISTGRRTAPIARWIGEQSQGKTHLVQLGRRGGETVDAFDLVVACEHFRLPLHPHRMEIVAPLNAVTPARLAQAAAQWRGLFGDAPRPHIVLVAGGTCARHWLDSDTARRIGVEVRAFADSANGSVFAITSPRTGAEAAAALRAGLGEGAHLHEWRPGEQHNPYMAHLALADAIVVTGESESMLAEAAAAGKPMFIYPLPERRLGFRRPAEWIASRAEARPRKAKGTVRPQQGLEYLCARLIAAGLIRPPRHLDQFHRGLIRNGVARYFDGSFQNGTYRRLHDMDDVAARVRRLLGFNTATEAEPSSGGSDHSVAGVESPLTWRVQAGRNGSGASHRNDRRVGTSVP